MMPESVVCSPTAVTRSRRLPPMATVPPATAAPGALDIARDSPVIMDSSTSAVLPIRSHRQRHEIRVVRGPRRLQAASQEELFRRLTPLPAERCLAAARLTRRGHFGL